MLPRDEQIKRAAQMRAAIMALMSTNHSQEYTMPQLAAALKELVEELEYKDYHMYSVLRSMVSNKQIYLRKEGNINYYAAQAIKKVNDRVPLELVGARKESAAADTPGLIVDIVKSTGRVRLTIGGIVLDIGVVGK